MFDANSPTRVCVDIPIIEDDILEDNETFVVTLTTTDDRVILQPDDGVVTIIDTSGINEVIYV